jgi:hypothetical protein
MLGKLQAAAAVAQRADLNEFRILKRCESLAREGEGATGCTVARSKGLLEVQSAVL